MKRTTNNRAIILIAAMIVIVAASTRLKADTGVCGSGGGTTTLPFTDVLSSNAFFCSIAEAYFSGLSNGTTATTYAPSANVLREQMAAFVTRTLDQSVKRGSKRAALGQFWTTQTEHNLGLTTVGGSPNRVKSDGLDLWVPNQNGQVKRVRASDGSVQGTWTGINQPFLVLVAMGKVFIASNDVPNLYQIDPAQAPGAATLVTQGLGENPYDITFDGERIWIANSSPAHPSLSIVTVSPLSVSLVNTGFTQPSGIIYDGANIWITDLKPAAAGMLMELTNSGNIIMSVPVGLGPQLPVFDGTNIWVPNFLSDTVSVVRATGSLAGTVLATLNGNGLDFPFQAAFDGERILVTNLNGNSVSLWKATDLTPIGTFSTGANTEPLGVCSDGMNFWITLAFGQALARF